MDSLTQIVLGAAVGEAVLGKKVGNKALLYGAIAGTIPDLDVFFGNFTDTITAIEWHRGFSHSIFFCVLMAPILGWLINRIERKYDLGWKPWAILSFWGLFTHPLLDAFTTWGTQLFWPTNKSIAFSSISVIDPLYTIPFLICTIMVLFYNKDSEKRAKINRYGLTISSFYLFSSLLIKYTVTEQFDSALQSQGIEYTAISTRPSLMNTILWNANIDTPDAYLIGDYSFFDTQSIKFKRYPKNRADTNDIVQFKNVQRLIKISEGWYLIDQKDDYWKFNDLRFGSIIKKDGSETFTFSYRLDVKNNQIIASETEKTRGDAKFLMKNLWNRILGN